MYIVLISCKLQENATQVGKYFPGYLCLCIIHVLYDLYLDGLKEVGGLFEIILI